ncbi:MAG TPA: hypothetical protein VNE21_05250, partial [Mycobacteriales bacterium]|nr:hypothetical protein [Mycobacteriales bacterium]
LNTNLATAVALLVWLILDMGFSRQRKPTLLGSVNGMIVGLVAITPAAGYVDGVGAIAIGLIASTIVWLSWNYLGKTRLMQRVDDTLGVFHTHGVAGLVGGVLVGFLANPKMIVYIAPGFSAKGLLYGHPWQVMLQLGAAGTVIVWDALVTFVLLKVIGRFVRLRMTDEELQIGDLAVHEEELYPADILAARPDRTVAVGATSAAATANPTAGTV